MIYLNNAATSYPKPDTVIKAYTDSLKNPPSGQFRSAYAADRGDVFDLCRQRLGLLFGISDTDRIFFTSGSTEGLNSIISGLGIKAEQVITTVTEHNSVLRPLYNIPQIKGRPVLVPCDANGYIEPELIENEAKKGGAKAVILNHCSNVTGAVQDAAAVGDISGRYGLIYILDVSQSAGCLEIKADEWGVDALAFTGHKSLMGPQGTGGYYVRAGIDLKPLKYGGTGLDSSRVEYPENDYEYEVGTQNAAGTEALSCALQWVMDQGTDSIRAKEEMLSLRVIEGLSSLDGIRIIGSDQDRRGPVISLVSDRFDPSDLAYILQNSFGIVTRAGLHCSPLIHDCIRSGKKGTLRVSFSYLNTESDADGFISAMREILQ